MRTTAVASRVEAAKAVWTSGVFATWMGLNLLDAVLSFHLLGIGGTEGNPLLAAIQSQVGGNLMLLTKLLLAAAAGLAVGMLGRTALLGVANRLMAVVVLYNLGLAAYVGVAAGPSLISG